jgi:hypothetical protein
MRFVILVAVYAMLISNLKVAIMQDIMNRDAARAEEFWKKSMGL